MMVIDSLELALIHLEYASVDFSHRKGSASHPLEREDVEALLPKITAAERAVQAALQAMQVSSEQGGASEARGV
jgi:hypothetical protein